MLRKSLISVLLATILATILGTSSTALAAKKSASTSGIFIAFVDLTPFTHPYKADLSFNWWGYWEWDYYYANWATAAWNFTHGLTITNGRACEIFMYGGPCVAGSAPYGSWTDLVTGEVFPIPSSTFKNIGCLVDFPKRCLQLQSNFGVYMTGRGKGYNTSVFVIWQSASPWTSRVYNWPRIDLW